MRANLTFGTGAASTPRKTLAPALSQSTGSGRASDQAIGERRRRAIWGRIAFSPPAGSVVYLKGVGLHAVTEEQAVNHILGQLDAGCGGWVATPNLDHLRRLQQDTVLTSLYCAATMVLADGMPLVWASRLAGTPLPQRVAGSSLINTLSAGAAKGGRSIYLLGGAAGTAQRAAEVLCDRYVGLRIAGIHCPPVGFENDPAQVRRIIDLLCIANPDIVYVGLGSPKQELLIGQLRQYLPQAWWLGIGISFSFLTGHVRRAPLWMQKTGLEWLHRLGQEPARLAKRYLIQGLPFAISLLAGAAWQRMGGGIAQPELAWPLASIRLPVSAVSAEPAELNRKAA